MPIAHVFSPSILRSVVGSRTGGASWAVRRGTIPRKRSNPIAGFIDLSLGSFSVVEERPACHAVPLGEGVRGRAESPPMVTVCFFFST
jgi:hypothetical protein